MKLIKKGVQPNSLTQFKNQNGVFENIDRQVKDDLYDSLINEQKGVCAYCNQLLKSTRKIEHHCERSICNGLGKTTDKTLEYSNLLAVCTGKTGKKNIIHCDSKKATFNSTNGLPITLNPLNINHIKTIKYSSTGLISSSNDLFDYEINTILELNTPHLKDARRDKWIKIMKLTFTNRKINKAKLHRILGNELRTVCYQKPFPGLSEYMLVKYG